MYRIEGMQLERRLAFIVLTSFYKKYKIFSLDKSKITFKLLLKV